MVFMFGVSISYPNKIENYEAKKIKQKKGREREGEKEEEKKMTLKNNLINNSRCRTNTPE